MKTIMKPWGFELIFANTEKYVGKILNVNVGQSLSLQYHKEKDETIYIQEGSIKFEHYFEGEDPVITELRVGQAFHIMPGMRHRMTAISGDSNRCARILEVSTPQLDDVVRLEDNYGRVA